MSKLSLNDRSVLFDVAEEVQNDEDVRVLIKAMRSIMFKENGIGLAAPQIGVSKRIILFKTGSILQVLINPVITKRKLGKTKSIEGCLSFPETVGKEGTPVIMHRDKMITVEGINRYGKFVKLKLRGLDSFVVQHEVDHLNGITIKT